MVHRVLACLNTLVDLVLDPGWDHHYDNFEQRQAEIKALRHLIDVDQLLLFIPPILIANVHLSLEYHSGRGQAHDVVRRLLRLGNTHLKVDCDRVLEQANLLTLEHPEIDLYEAILLPYASVLKADAIIAQRPEAFRQLMRTASAEIPAFNVPIVEPGEFLSWVQDAPVSPAEDEILVFTPEHRIITLPQRATPVDFAYFIHTRLGDKCSKALVDGIEVPLDTRLWTNCTVEILKSSEPALKQEWLNFVVTRTARNGIKRGLKRLWTERGWEMAKRNFGKNVRAYRPKLESVAEKLHCNTNELMAKLGSGELTLTQMQSLMRECSYQQVSRQALCADTTASDRSPTTGLVGLDNRPWKLASCCNPLPGDKIISISGSGSRTIRIHQADCPNLAKLNPQKLHPVTWQGDTWRMHLQIIMADQADIVRPLLNRLVDHQLRPNLRNLTIAADNTLWVSLTILINSRAHLDEILTEIRAMPRVIQVKVTKLIFAPEE